MDTDVVKIIEWYSENELLWNQRHANYPNKHLRNECFSKILNEFSLSGNSQWTEKTIKAKIRSLRTQFANEVKKEKKSLKSGSSADDIYKSKWKYFDSLSFLQDVVISDPTISNLSTYSNDETEILSIDGDSFEFDETPKPNKKKRGDDNYAFIEKESEVICQVLKSISQDQPPPQDGLTLWCMSLVDTLKLIKDPITLETTKIGIQQLILNNIPK
ncbi:hypothetical protein RDWZM_009878 [Blomia tropicalis]|uniref:MADF domain-containing protein n=1 Tax=Blomia tropicalis TaxID=40697 RepID=A0A9Q0RH72_BLOTA|nr:hypothetical protein RDWZM_009878 [Blomia tropicalis]